MFPDEPNVINYKTFLEDSAKINSNIAATILKIQERKTNKGLPYAVIKFSDLSTVFELFVFSETLVSNREMLKEGNSLLLSLSKNNSDKDRTGILIQYLPKFVKPMEDQKNIVDKEVIEKANPLLRQLLGFSYPYPQNLDEAEAKNTEGQYTKK